MNPFQSLIFAYLGIMRKMGRYKFSSDSLANFITFYKFAYCHINLVSISMGLFDLFKKDRGYELHSLEFCEVGKDGKRDTRPSSKHYTDSRYIMPVVKLLGGTLTRLPGPYKVLEKLVSGKYDDSVIAIPNGGTLSIHEFDGLRPCTIKK